MPVYEYEILEGDCDICGGRFSVKQSVGAAALTECPACKRPVRKAVSKFSTKRSKSLSDAKKAGFTVLKRLGKGEYEKH